VSDTPSTPEVTPTRSGLVVRVVAATVAAAAVAGLVAAGLLLGQVRGAAVQQAQAALARQADLVASSIDATAGVGGPTRPIRLVRVLEQQGINAFVLSADGRKPAQLTDDLAQTLLSGESVSVVDSDQDPELLIEGRPVSGGAIVLTQPVTVIADVAAESRRRILIAVLIGLAGASVIGVVLARWLSRPVRDAAAAANALASGDREVRLPTDGPHEVAELGTALNQLSDALRLSEDRQRQFLLSISHELRTPLTAIRGYAEALADGTIAPEAVSGVGATLESESQRLDHLVSDLLDLARLQADRFRLDLADVDLSALMRQAATVWRDRCAVEGVVVREEISDDLTARTDATRFRQIVDGLAENALRVTPSGAPIVLALRGVDGSVELEVRDGGPGLSDDDLDVAFERGVLHDRYRGVRPVGTGLGLALVGGLAQRRGGTARAQHAPEGGAGFTVRLPLTGPVGEPPPART
jgi:two-component system OmpR family sensor kinase